MPPNNLTLQPRIKMKKLELPPDKNHFRLNLGEMEYRHTTDWKNVNQTLQATDRNEKEVLCYMAYAIWSIEASNSEKFEEADQAFKKAQDWLDKIASE
jgi:hypothetical protein